MKISFRFFKLAYLSVVAAVFAMVAVAASADCLLNSVRGHEAAPPIGLEQRAETADALGDPALDGLFARYAELHRDAVGYSVSDLMGSSMMAKGNAEVHPRITR